MAVTMKKDTLKLFIGRTIDGMDEGGEDYGKLCYIILLACHVIDKDGNLTEEWKKSDLWMGGDDGTPLRLSPKAYGNALSVVRAVDRGKKG